MSIIFYHLFLLLYKLGIRLIAPWNRKAKLWLEGRQGLFDRIRAEMATAADKSGPVVWMHCSSLGEFEQGRPVLEELRRQAPGCRIVLSFFSPSGYTTRKDYKGADHIFYLPLDSPGNARAFIDLVKPDLVLWVKYDYWYYFLVELKKRNIPLLLISGIFREDQPFFKWYGRLHRYMLECFTHLFVQTEASKQLLQRLRLTTPVTVSGDTRFDRVIEIAAGGEREPLSLIAAFCGQQQVIVAGSTWEEDEEELDHYANTHPDIRFIVAPHEISEARLQEVERLFRHSMRYSVLEKQGAGVLARPPAAGRGAWPQPNVLIIDNIGMLSRLYRYATITYVGGGFGDDGVHNVLEAAVYGKPVVFGPVIEKYIEAVELTESGGGLIIDSALEAEKVFNRLLQNPQECQETGLASSQYVHSKKGATGRIIRYIQENRLLTN
ncbi:3-deoxy-D-manno-octulosonic acid transferase [Puia dinghuensis]|uniref:3-deoxy-D-manno-octulosonic acid transferase n=1 Tax=Puia dinghuensis TaxID=1792502 RepID=A0A8J2UDW5_9BACT|nr:glycosyltransferase N-terminal domain-containing protein [Puia dinghuensis]GGB04272.1 3-deoxy-D-manno-octulosonic acid transferase [Puia dinghuensis]